MPYKRPRSIPMMLLYLLKLYGLKRPIVIGLLGIIAVAGAAVAWWTLSSTECCPAREGFVPLASPVSECADTAAGQWVGYQHLDGYKYKFVLSVERDADDPRDLRGTIESTFWSGESTSTTPSPCSQRTVYEVEMDAKGQVDDHHMSFVGKSFEWTSDNDTGGYYPDGFTGELSADGREFHAVNDDGYNEVTDVVFRKIACAP